MSATAPSDTPIATEDAVVPGDAAAAQAIEVDSGQLSAIRDVASHVRFWLVAVGGLVLDLASKHWAFHTLGQGGGRGLIPNVLEFQTMLNEGALFGIGKGRTTLFLVASVLALLLVGWMFMQCPRRRWGLQIALGGILAGALGNMYDRATVKLLRDPLGSTIRYAKVSEDDVWVVLERYPPGVTKDVRRIPAGEAARLGDETGYVRDFIKIKNPFSSKVEIWPWVFNVADMLLVGGVAILAFHLWRDRKPDAAEPKAALDSPGSAA